MQVRKFDRMQVATPIPPLNCENSLSKCVTSTVCYKDLGNTLDFASFWLTFILPPSKASTFTFLFCQAISVCSDKCICLKYAKGIELQFGYRGTLLNQSRWCFVDKTVGFRYWIGLACSTVFEILKNWATSSSLSKQAQDFITHFYLHNKISQLSLLLF